MSAPVIRDDYRAEARELVEWLFAQARIYTAHAPALTGDIRRFEDAAALLDTFQAGLVPVPPHPLMRAELVRWHLVTDDMPPFHQIVLVAHETGVDAGWHDGFSWYCFGRVPQVVIAWAPLPRGPVPAPTPESRHDDEGASCA